MLELIIEFFAELFLNLLGEWVFGSISAPRVTARSFVTLALGLAGALLGWASTGLLPRPLIPVLGLRVTYVIVAPVGIAFIADAWVQRRLRRGKRPGLIATWTDAYVFAVAFAGFRLLSTL